MSLADIINWVEMELSKGRNDTVHDLLAFLAERMIDMNNVKNDEVKGFLNWLEREIGAEIEGLANKTAIKEYHENDFNHLIEVLKKNKGKLSIDLSSRKNQELLDKHFKESSATLAPLKARIKATDDLIDEIVFRLYGLAEDEINIVKGEKGTSL